MEAVESKLHPTNLQFIWSCPSCNLANAIFWDEWKSSKEVDICGRCSTKVSVLEPSTLNKTTL